MSTATFDKNQLKDIFRQAVLETLEERRDPVDPIFEKPVSSDAAPFGI